MIILKVTQKTFLKKFFKIFFQNFFFSVFPVFGGFDSWFFFKVGIKLIPFIYHPDRPITSIANEVSIIPTLGDMAVTKKSILTKKPEKSRFLTFWPVFWTLLKGRWCQTAEKKTENWFKLYAIISSHFWVQVEIFYI